MAGSWHPGPGTIGASYVLRVLYLSLRARDRINPSDSSTVPLRRLRVAGVEVFHPYRYPHSEIIGARWDEGRGDVGEKIWVVSGTAVRQAFFEDPRRRCRERDPILTACLHSERLRVPWRQEGQAVFEHGDAGRSQTDGQRRSQEPRLPIELWIDVGEVSGTISRTGTLGRRAGDGFHGPAQSSKTSQATATVIRCGRPISCLQEISA